MSDFNLLEGSPGGSDDMRVAVVSARFNSFVVEQLEKGCIDTLIEKGLDASKISLMRVPGAFELPLIAKRLAASNRYEAVIALGAVIRGGTPHFEYVCNEAARGLANAGMETGIPVIFGVLTVDNDEQAMERAGPGEGNKGAEAAATAIEMITLLRSID